MVGGDTKARQSRDGKRVHSGWRRGRRGAPQLQAPLGLGIYLILCVCNQQVNQQVDIIYMWILKNDPDVFETEQHKKAPFLFSFSWFMSIERIQGGGGQIK